MILFDLILLLVLGGFVFYGLWFGLINTLGVLVGTIAGAFLAARWYEPVADWAGFWRSHESRKSCLFFNSFYYH